MQNNTTQPIILFDGVCNFCNFWVNFTIKRDIKKNLLFAPLQGKTAANLLGQRNIDASALTSVVLIDGNKVYTQSSAALHICKYLSGGWKLGYAFLAIPKFIRDFFYNIVARNRYRWFGKKESCMIPTNELKARFLE